MIDNELLQQVLRLDEASRHELRAAIDSSLDDGDVDHALASFLDVRIAHVDQNPNDRLTVDELKKHLRETRDGTRAG